MVYFEVCTIVQSNNPFFRHHFVGDVFSYAEFRGYRYSELATWGWSNWPE